MNCAILGTGKIGIDLYYKLKKKKNNISIFNTNSKSEGAKYCKKNNFNYFSSGINGILKKKNQFDLIFDTTNAKSNLKHYKLIKDKYFINLTPSGIGEFYIPYIDEQKKLKTRSFNLITCGGQSTIPIIYEINKLIKKINYVEVVSAISSKSAGLATRLNVNEYLEITSNAIKKYTKIKNVKVILNINPGNPPVNMSNSIYFQLKKDLSKKQIYELKKILQRVNKKMKNYAKGFECKYIGNIGNKIYKITLSVTGNGDYLPKYSGNLDIITNMASLIVNKIYK